MSATTSKQEQLLCLGEAALSTALDAGAENAEIAVSHGSQADVEFEKNDISVALTSEETVVGVRVLRDGRCGFASTNDLSAIDGCILDALAIAAASEPNEHNGFPMAQEIAEIQGLHCHKTGSLSIADVTKFGADLLAAVRSTDDRVQIDSGGVGAGLTTRLVLNSHGLRAMESRSSLGASLFGMAVENGTPGSFVVEGSSACSSVGIEETLQQVASRFCEKTLGALNPQAGKSFLGSVLLSPEAVSSFVVGNLLTMLSSSTHRRNRSLLAGRLGDTIASTAFSLRDDATIKGRVTSSAFDREGTPKAALSLIEDGVFTNLFYNHFEAQAGGRAAGSTGHASGSALQSPGVGCGAIGVDEGSTPLKEMMVHSSPMVIVERFSGSVNPVTGAYSGVVKGGYLVENGERRPVGETLISGNILDLISSIAGISQERVDVFGRSLIPWILCENISVTAG